jgi:ribosome maturation protein Sdo1
MEKTINPETRRPYTITMIERLMHEIHFAVDPNLTSKEQVRTYTILPYSDIITVGVQVLQWGHVIQGILIYSITIGVE